MIHLLKVLCKVSLIFTLAYLTYTDIKFSKVKNKVILFQFLLEILVISFILKNNSLSQITFHILLRIMIPVIVLVLPYMFKGIGAGDIKVFIVLSIASGVKKIIVIMWLSFALALAYEMLIKFIRRQGGSNKEFMKRKFCLMPFITISSFLWLIGVI